MKFIFADALDIIDPEYDFLLDRSKVKDSAYWLGKYPHEFFPRPPYDGILISKGVVGHPNMPGKYSTSQAMRFRRVGAREFLRLASRRYRDLDIFGDCGAFTYAKADVPPYSTDDLLDFYADGGFTHGCSLDHVILEFKPQPASGLLGGSRRARERYELTQQNAREFLRLSKSLGRRFTPLGVVQGWSPGSMAQAARNLERMGYRYISIGGMVPLASPAVHLCLRAIRATLRPSTKLHVLGFAKAEQIEEFTGYGIASFDSTSPLLRAFKDARANYFLRDKKGALSYYTAIRIPHAIENKRFKVRSKQGSASQEHLLDLEQKALTAVRDFDHRKRGLEPTLRAVLAYNREFLWDSRVSIQANETKVEKSERDLRRTLGDRPWQRCRCRVCAEAGVEVMIFRSSNRNKRRGFHNLKVYYDHFRKAVA